MAAHMSQLGPNTMVQHDNDNHHSVTSYHNRELPYANRVCHEANVARAYEIHLAKMKNIKPTTPFSSKPKKFSFLNSKVSKNYHADLRGKIILRENLQLLKKLATIQAEPVSKRLQAKAERYRGPKIKKVRALERQRVRDDHTRENLRIMRRLQTVQTHYPVDAYRQTRQREVKKLSHDLELEEESHGASSHGSPAGRSIASAPDRDHMFATLSGYNSTTGQPPATAPGGLEGDESFYSMPTMADYQMPAPSGGGDVGTKVTLPPLKSKSGKHKSGERVGRSKSATKVKSARSAKGEGAGEEGGVGEEGGEADDSVKGTSKPGKGGPKLPAPVPQALNIHSQECTFTVMSGHAIENLVCTVKCVVALPLRNNSAILYDIFLANNKVAQLSIEVSDAQKLIALWDQSGVDSGVDADDVLDMYEFLSQMFLEADMDGSGSLERDEFFELLQDADLGISAAELHLVLSEADEDDDGEIDYVEFLPVAIDLVQSFKARRSAQKEQDKVQADLSDEALKLLYSGQVDMLIQKVLGLCAETDLHDHGSLSRFEFKNALKKAGQDLTRVEMNMVLASMPRDAFGKIRFSEFTDVMHKVRFTTIKNSIMETRASDTEKVLMGLCREEELAGMDLDEDTEPTYTGLITTLQLSNVLTNVKLSLNRLQVTSVMCEVDVQDGFLDYWLFVPVAARNIDIMNDPVTIQKKADLLAREQIKPEDFLKGKKEEELKEELENLFIQYDADNSGELDVEEFEHCLNSLDLGLTKGQITALTTLADEDRSGTIDKDEFMEFAFHHLVHLQREKHMRQIQSTLDHSNSTEPSEVGRLDSAETARSRSASAASGDGGVDAGTGGTGKMASTDGDPIVVRSASEILESAMADDADAMRSIDNDLMKMFAQADTAGLGYLTPKVFRDMLEALELGLSPYQMAMLTAEADAGETGKIYYSAFVPIGLKMLYSYKAKLSAEKKWEIREQEAEVEAEERSHNLQVQLDSTIHEIELAFHAADVTSGLEVLPRDAFIRCLKEPRAGLPRTEINMILSRMPGGKNMADTAGTTSYKDFRSVMQEVRRQTMKRMVLNEMPSSTLEKHLVTLFDEWAKKHSTDGSDLGYMPAGGIHEVMSHATHLNLKRQDLLTVMSLQKDCLASESGMDGMDTPIPGPPGVDKAAVAFSEDIPPDMNIDYWKFASCAAEMISKFFDVQEIERHAQLLSTAMTSPMNLLGGMQQEQLEKRLTAEFRGGDKRRTGLVSALEFKNCIQTIKQLEASDSEIDMIIGQVPKDDQGRLKWKEWMEHAFDTLLSLAKTRAAAAEAGGPKENESPAEALKRLAAAFDKTPDSVSDHMVMTVSERLISLLDLKIVEKNTEADQLEPTDPDAEDALEYSAEFKRPMTDEEKRELEKLKQSQEATRHGSSMGFRPSSNAGTGAGSPGSPRGGSSRKSLLRQMTGTPPTAKQLDTDGGLEPIASKPKDYDLLCKVGVKCPLVAPSGAHLTTALKIPSQFDKDPQLAHHMATVEVRDQKSSAKVIVLDVTSGAQFVLMRKLPSLARVDVEVARQWAAQLAVKVCIEISEDGTHGISFPSFREQTQRGGL